MRWSKGMLLVATVTSAGTSLAAQARGVMTDSARLQGTWSMVAGSADGIAMTADMAKSMKRVAEGPYVTISMNGQMYFKAHFMLAAGKAPKEIDYQMMEGPTKGATQLGVYKINGDTAWFNFAAPGKPRAADFTAAAGEQRTYSVWVRTKP